MQARWAVMGLAVAAGMGGAARGDDRATALAVLERAVKAHGGAGALSRAGVSVRTGSGIAWVGAALPLQTEMIVNLPDQLRLTMDVNRSLVLIVVNGTEGWQSTGGMAAELTKERLGELKEECYVLWLETLAPLVKDGFELAPLPEVKVLGKPAMGVKVSARGRPDVRLYFDRESGLLVRISRKAREAGLEVDKEYLFTDHRDFDGVKLPTREVMNLNGKKTTEVTYSAYKFLRKADDRAFTRP